MNESTSMSMKNHLAETLKERRMTMFEKLVKDRYSVRKYSERQVESEILQKILETGRLSPTAANLQPQKIYVLKTEKAMEKAGSAGNMTECSDG